MFGIFLFGWAKASKCKKAIKRARSRLRLLKNKRDAIARQLREDVAELIKNGYEEIAVNRVEQLIKDESSAAAYELLDHFCEFILTQLSYIRKHKDCPNDINEAVSSLIFASARCGDVPELCVIRKLFGERYGEKFTTTAVELYPGNLVNHQIKENLSVKSVPDNLKYRVVDEIARDYCLQPELLAIEYYPVQVNESKGFQVEKDDQIDDTIAGSQIHRLEVEEIERDIICSDLSISNSLCRPKDSGSLQVSNETDCHALVSTVQLYPPYVLSSPLQKKVDKVGNFAELDSFTSMEDVGEKLALASSADYGSLPPFSEKVVDYVDDIEGRQIDVSKDAACQDQRVIKFRSSCSPRKEKVEHFCYQSDVPGNKSPSEKSSTRSSRKSKRTPEKTSRRRSASPGITDIESLVYYHKPCRNPSVHKHGAHCRRKHQKSLVEGISQLNYAQPRLKQHNSLEMKTKLQLCQSKYDTRRRSFNLEMKGCSLDHPCCYLRVYDKDCLEVSPMKPQRGIRSHAQLEVLAGEPCHCRPFWKEELNEEKELVTIPQRPNRNSFTGTPMYNVFTYPDCHIDKQNKGTKPEASESLADVTSSNISCSRTTGSSTGIGTAAPYSRAVTMPPERQNHCKNKMLRTYSCASQYPKHVHPKLPDYDDIEAKFVALKRERLGQKETKTAVSSDRQLK